MIHLFISILAVAAVAMYIGKTIQDDKVKGGMKRSIIIFDIIMIILLILMVVGVAGYIERTAHEAGVAAFLNGKCDLRISDLVVEDGVVKSIVWSEGI